MSVYQGSNVSLELPFLKEWFEPMFELARRRSTGDVRNSLPKSPEALVGWFRKAGLENMKIENLDLEWRFDDPETVVQYLVRGVRAFESELMELPWDDRRAVVAELIDRGHDVCARYPLQQRRVRLPIHHVKGFVPM